MHQEVVQTLIAPTNPKILLGLERIKHVLSLLDNPQNAYKVIHITGTNGKGSVAAFLETGLYHSGCNIGKFTTPHINHINETIRYNCINIDDADIEQNFFIVKSILITHNLELTQFELQVVIMFYYFKQKNIDYLILEVGMGGQNDATNVIDNPICVVITNIALEHTQWFGNTLTDIATEKSGIIKNNCPVIIADNTSELQNAVKQKTNRVTNVLDKYEINTTLNFTNFTTNIVIKNDSNKQYSLNLFGKFQAYNFLCAYEIFNLLGIHEESIKYSASNTKHKGRLELISHNPLVVFDATHNEAGSKALYETITVGYNPNNVVIITSILKDKNIAGMLDYFTKIADIIVFTSITNTNRGLLASEIYQIAINQQKRIPTKFINIDNISNAIDYAKKKNKKLVLITGSLYLLQQYT